MRTAVSAQFVPGREALAFRAALRGELDLPGVFAAPLPCVVAALSAASHWHPTATVLPDASLAEWSEADADWRAS